MNIALKIITLAQILVVIATFLFFCLSVAVVIHHRDASPNSAWVVFGGLFTGICVIANLSRKQEKL